jgi:predicted PurR-regulated permease PerM
MKKFFKKGSAEIVSIVLGIVVIGGLALAVTGTLSKQTNASMNQGMKTQTQQLVKNYNEAATPQDAQAVGLTTH